LKGAKIENQLGTTRVDAAPDTKSSFWPCLGVKNVARDGCLHQHNGGAAPTWMQYMTAYGALVYYGYMESNQQIGKIVVLT
jgi:hypothetical protein